MNAIYSLGTSAAVANSGITISGNNISDYFSATLVSIGINVAATGNSAWTITNNKLFQTATRVFTTGNTHNGIAVLSGAGYTITGNTIGFADASENGTTNLLGNTGAVTGTFPTSYTVTTTNANTTRYIAISCAFTAGGAVSNIQGNTIGGFALYSSSGARRRTASGAASTSRRVTQTWYHDKQYDRRHDWRGRGFGKFRLHYCHNGRNSGGHLCNEHEHSHNSEQYDWFCRRYRNERGCKRRLHWH